MSKLKTYSRLLRVENYVKNLFIFAPLFFDFQFDIISISRAFIIFVLFCFLASGVYIFNDIFDLESDKIHPVKKFRPIASGLISIKRASVIGVLLIATGLITTLFIDLKLFYTFLSYLIINILYNLFLKKIPIVDVLIISFGFIIRIFAGSYATGIPASYWILIMTFLLSLFLGFSKRRADIILAKNNNIKANNIRIFSITSINRILFIFAFLICTFYIAYTVSKEVIFRIGSPFVFLTSIFVILGVFRYITLLRSSKQYKDPTAIIIGDWKLQGIIFIWILSFIIIIYI